MHVLARLCPWCWLAGSFANMAMPDSTVRDFVSWSHASLAVVTSLLYWKWPDEAGLIMVVLLSMAYFCHDLAYCTVKDAFFWHHVLCIFGLPLAALYETNRYCLAVIFGFLELSNCGLYPSSLFPESSTLHKCSLCWFATRVVFLPFLMQGLTNDFIRLLCFILWVSGVVWLVLSYAHTLRQ